MAIASVFESTNDAARRPASRAASVRQRRIAAAPALGYHDTEPGMSKRVRAQIKHEMLSSMDRAQTKNG